MKALVLAAVVSVVALAGAGCNRQPSADSTEKLASDNKLVNPKITIARGCLTGSADQFILTNLEHGASVPNAPDGQPAGGTIATTDSYRLVGLEDRLRGLVGQRIEVTGDSVPEQVVDLVSATPSSAPANGATGTTGHDGNVSTASRARIEIHALKVNSVNPLGDKCPGS